MKRTVMTCLMAVGVWLTALAGNTITLTSTEGHPNDEVEVAVMLTNDAEVTALEVLIPLADALHYVDGSVVINAERANGHAISAAEQDGKLNICIYSLGLTSLKGTEGEVCRFKLKLGKEPATYTLIPEVVMSDAGGSAIACNVTSGAVTLLSPKIEVTTSTIDYGRVPIRSSYTKTLTIRNSGNEPLEITDIVFDNADLSASSVPCTIAAGSVSNFALTYAPQQRGTVTSNVTITSNAINPKAGKAVVKAQPFSVNELHVQRVEGISDQEVTIVLKMNNMEPIAGAQCEFTLPDALKYVEGSATVGNRCKETDHKVSGVGNGKVLTLFMYSLTNTTLPEGDGELITFRVRLDGKSGSYRLDPKEVVLSNTAMENMTSATSSNYVVIKSPKFSGTNILDMGDIPVTHKSTATYSIYNSSQVPLAINKVTFLAEGYTIEEELPLTIEPWQTKALTVAYTPTKEGAYKTTMQIYTNDPTNRMHSVAVSGKVYEPNHIVVSGDNTQSGYRFVFGMDNYTEIVAIQMNIKWLLGMKTSTAMLTPTERLKNHAYLLTDMGNGVYQVLIYSMANTSIAGNGGALFAIDYAAAEGTSYQNTELCVTDIVLSDAKGNNYVSGDEVKAKAAFSNFTLRFVVEGETISEQFVKQGTAITAPEMPSREGYSFVWTGLSETMPSNNLAVTGTYTVNNYSVIYKVDGEVYKTESIAYGTELTAIEAPTKEGHTFSGWSELPKTMPAGDVVITGSFTVNEYKITYMVDGVEHHEASIAYGTELVAIEVPTKEGHTFSGWSELPKTMPAGDVVITGSFTVNSYSVVYKVDGEAYRTETVAYGTELVAIEAPTKEGHTFSGWSELPKTMPAGDVVITGSFTVNEYKITYMVDGVEHHEASIAYGTELTAIEAPTKEGHTFSGWSELPKTMPAEDVVITGSFTVNSYSVIYKVDGEVYRTESIAYGTELTAIEAPTKEGHTFSGWSELPETMPAGDVVITGSFTVNEYKITYMVDGVEHHEASIAYGTELTAIDDPTKEGHTFGGWSELPKTMPAGDVVITGSFTVNSYSVIYKVDGEVYRTEEVAYGSKVVLIDDPTKEGHTFSGWSELPETMPAEDVIVTGSFTVNEYKITYMVDGKEHHTASIAYGTELTAIEAPTKEGYAFSGWSELPETMPAEDVVITGSFTVNSYSVIYKVDGEVYRTEEVVYGSKVVLIDGPTKEGHTFSGWSELPETMPAGDVVITGSFTVNSYSVIYKVDGEVYRTEEVAYGSKVILIDDPTKEGHTFSGWRKEGNAESESPMWKEIDIANNADAMLYTNAPCTNTTYGDQFQGWHVLFDNNPNTIFHSEYNRVESADGLDHYLRVDMGENKTVGKFTFTYTVRGNDASYTPSRIVVEGANEPNGDYTEIAVLTNLPRNMGAVYESDILGKDDEGYRYIRYRVTETVYNKKVYNHPYFYFAEFGMAGCVKNNYIMPAHDLVFEGYYTKNKYLVTFKVDDEVVSSDLLEYGVEIIVPEAPEKNGYSFVGWGDVADKVPANDVTYEGRYSVNTYKVHYYIEDELVHTEEIAYGEEIPMYVYVPSDEEGEFLGWEGDAYETMPAHDITYVGKMEYLDTAIKRLMLNGGELMIYDLQGRRVLDTENIKGGLYIVNGRKVLVK